MMKTNQQTEQQQQQHNCPGVLRSHVHCTRFPNPFFGIPHITTPSQREEKNCRPEPAESPSFISLISPQFGDILPPSCAKGLWRHIFDRCTPAYLFENTHGVFLPRKMGEAGLGAWVVPYSRILPTVSQQIVFLMASKTKPSLFWSGKTSTVSP